MREEMLGLLRVMAPWLAVPSAWSADTELCLAWQRGWALDLV